MQLISLILTMSNYFSIIIRCIYSVVFIIRHEHNSYQLVFFWLSKLKCFKQSYMILFILFFINKLKFFFIYVHFKDNKILTYLFHKHLLHISSCLFLSVILSKHIFYKHSLFSFIFFSCILSVYKTFFLNINIY